MLSSGVMDVRGFLDEGMKVAIGTDVAGGYSASMLDAIRQVFSHYTILYGCRIVPP
jgi:guanine deaminase